MCRERRASALHNGLKYRFLLELRCCRAEALHNGLKHRFSLDALLQGGSPALPACAVRLAGTLALQTFSNAL